MKFRVRISGGVPDFSRERMRSCLLFYNLDVAKTAPPRGITDPRRLFDAARRGGAGVVARDTGIAQRTEFGVASAAMRVRISLPVPLFPSSNGEDRGPSSRVCRFKSGRERQPRFHLAVAQPAARVVRDDEDAGSNPAGETHRF